MNVLYALFNVIYISRAVKMFASHERESQMYRTSIDRRPCKWFMNVSKALLLWKAIMSRNTGMSV